MNRRAELVASLRGEAGRTRERLWDLSKAFDSLADGIRDAAQVQHDDVEGIAARLRFVATSAALLSNELSAVAGRLDALGTVLRDA